MYISMSPTKPTKQTSTEARDSMNPNPDRARRSQHNADLNLPAQVAAAVVASKYFKFAIKTGSKSEH